MQMPRKANLSQLNAMFSIQYASGNLSRLNMRLLG